MMLIAVYDLRSINTVPASQAAKPKMGIYSNDFFAKAPVGLGASYKKELTQLRK